MKEIKAYIHRNRISDVLYELEKSNFCKSVCHISINDMDSVTQSSKKNERNFPIEVGEDNINTVKLVLICDNERADEAISLISEHARTGQPLAGWIYCIDVYNAMPIVN